MPTLLKTVLGKRSGEEAKLDSVETSSDEASSGSGSGSGSDSDDSDDDEAESNHEMEESLPSCREAVENFKWTDPRTKRLTCLMCPDKEILHKKSDPWAFHLETNAHKRRFARYSNFITDFLSTKGEEELPRDPRILVSELDHEVMEAQRPKERVKPEIVKTSRKLGPQARLRRIRSIDKRTRRLTNKRQQAGLPVNPSIEADAHKAKAELGWTPELEVMWVKEAEDEKAALVAKRETARLATRAEMSDKNFMQTLKKMEGRVAKAKASCEKMGKPYDPANVAAERNLERFKRETNFEEKMKAIEAAGLLKPKPAPQPGQDEPNRKIRKAKRLAEAEAKAAAEAGGDVAMEDVAGLSKKERKRSKKQAVQEEMAEAAAVQDTLVPDVKEERPRKRAKKEKNLLAKEGAQVANAEVREVQNGDDSPLPSVGTPASDKQARKKAEKAGKEERPAKTDAEPERPAFILDPFGAGASEIKLDLGDEAPIKRAKKADKIKAFR